MKLTDCVTAAFLAVVAFGCVPFPHQDRTTPFVQGVISKGESPVVGVPVMILPGDDESCTGVGPEVTTNARGRFQFSPVMEYRFFVVLMGHSVFRWQVCAKPTDRWVLLSRGYDYTLQSPGPMGIVTLTCSIGEADAATCTESLDLEATPEKVEDWLEAE